jgi:DNA-binding transcriptional LysR family regulator
MSSWVDRIGRRLKLRDLHILMEVVRCGSMVKAAHHLGVSTPVVSKTIAEVEHTLGVPLLDRGPRGVEPTLYGRAFIKRSAGVFDELRLSVEEIESLRDPSAGEVRIGSTGPLAAGIVPAVIETLTRRYPRISIQVLDAVLDTLLRELRDRNIDLAIGRATAPIADEDMESEVLFNDRLLVVAGLRNKWTTRRKIRLDELMDEPWTLPPVGSIPATNIADAFRSVGVPVPRTTAPSASISVIVHLVVAGRFLTVLPESMVHFNVKNLPLKVLPVDFPIQQRPVVIVTPKNRTLSPTAKRFIDTARALTRPLAYLK